MQEAWKTVLVGCDLSPSSELAMSHAARLARGLNARLDLAYVHQPLMSAVPEAMLTPIDDTAALAEVECRLRELAARLADHIPGEIHIRIGSPVSELLQLITELAPEFVVVGSHGRGAVMRMLLGSVAEQLCRRSPVPVLVVPAPERAATAKQAHRSAG
jgi:nucleotide-binding universal stress UspA family protein